MDEEEELENTLIGQEEEEAPAIDAGDVMMGGLGLGGAAYAAQTGRAPTTPPSPQVLNILTGRDAPRSSFAQRVAANDAARLAAQPKPPALIGSTQVGTTTGFQPPSVTSTTSNPLATTSTGTPPRGQPRLPGPVRPSADDFDFRINPARASRLARIGGPGALIYGAADVGIEALTGRGLSERIGEGAGGFVGNLLFPGAQSQPAFTEAELQQARDNLSTGAQFSLMEEDAEASVAPVTEVTPIQAALGALDEEIAGRESNIVNNQVELAKQIRELGTVTDDQRAAQDFLNERAERSGTTATDVITPFQDQAQLTADLFTDPNTAIGQFVPRATFTLPDGTIIQEDEGGNRREISAEQLRQFEQDMAGLGQAQQSRTFSQEETMARLGGRTLNEYLNAPPVRTPGISGLKTDPQGRMIPNVGRFQPQPVAPQPVAPQPVAPQPVAPQTPPAQLSDFERASLERQQRIGGTGSFAGDSAAREARLAERDRLPGETQTERDTRVAQSRTTSDQTVGLSFDDAKRRAEGQLAARGISNPSASMVNDLARGIQAGEAERLETLNLQRDLTQGRIALMDEQLAESGIVPSAPPVVDPETGVITQKYSDGTTRFKGVGRSPGGGGFDLDGFVSDDEDSKSSDTVRMTDRDGKLREVPKGDVQEAIKNGYTPVGEDFTPNI